MIKRYTDHSANERTYLAWIRTAIAIMAFGFLIEKFDLFISYLGKSIGNQDNYKSSLSVEIVGMGLFLVGVFIVITATVRFFAYKKNIELEKSIPYSVKKTNILLSSLIILLAVFLFIYMMQKLIE